jgi:hypothetical protein
MVTTKLYSAGGDFESKWSVLSLMAHQAYILEGLVRTTEMSEGFKDWRIYCPEVNLTELQEGNDMQFVSFSNCTSSMTSLWYHGTLLNFNSHHGMICPPAQIKGMKR